MWCKNCRQDIPGVLSQNDKQFCCVVGQLLGVAPDAGGTSADPRSTSNAEDQVHHPRTHYDPWEVNEKLRHAERVLQLGRRPDRGLIKHSASIRAFARRRAKRSGRAATRGATRSLRPLAWLLIATGTSGLSAVPC